MLVLSRKQGETIQIGPDILITIVTTGHQVKVGIVAPKDVTILRGELFDGDPVSNLLRNPTHSNVVANRR